LNKYEQKVALFLINRELYKRETKALNEWRANKKFDFRENLKGDKEYRRLLLLKRNIEDINSIWQGMFNHSRTRSPRDVKFIDATPYEFKTRIPHSISEDEQAWADMTTDEFFEALRTEELDSVHE